MLAQQGLAQYYLFRSQEYEKAIGPLHDLADAGESYPALEAFGIAGLVVAEAKLGDMREARDEMSRLEQRHARPVAASVAAIWPVCSRTTLQDLDRQCG